MKDKELLAVVGETEIVLCGKSKEVSDSVVSVRKHPRERNGSGGGRQLFVQTCGPAPCR